MIRKLRTERDNQQWMLDLALNMRGRVQNFEGDLPDVPKRVRNYRMIPKAWREAAERHEALARRAHRRGDRATATEHYDHAIEAYRSAQHPIYFDEDAIEAFQELEAPKELWVFENQFHQLRGFGNLGGLDGHNYVFDWLRMVLMGKGVRAKHSRIAYVTEKGDGPWGDCDWTPTVKPGQAYF